MLKKTSVFLCVCLLYQTMSSSPVLAWGLDVHRFITDRAIQILPQPLRSFFQKHRAFVVEHSVDPDLWRSAGFVEEPSRHFLDLDAFGEYPFSELPRDRESARERFGSEMIEKEGQVPWRTVEINQRLVDAFEQLKPEGNRYAAEDVKFFSAILSHYVSDAHVPFHTVKNYDGQLTGQTGIHSRFETELFLRYQREIVVSPPRLYPVERPLDLMFGILLKSFTLVDPILNADLKSIEGLESYDEIYFQRLFRSTRSILESQVSDSISTVASMIVGAWEKAGRPDLPLEAKVVNRKIRP